MNEQMKSSRKRKMKMWTEWWIHMLGYSLVLILTSKLFKDFIIDLSYCGIYALLLSVVIYILNKTIKPIIFYLTLPLTGLTLGLFYFVINLIILKIADWILLGHFNIGLGITSIFMAISISMMNFLLEGLMIKPMIRRVEQ